MIVYRKAVNNEGQFQAFQRFSSSKLVLKTFESYFSALNHYKIGSKSSRQAQTRKLFLNHYRWLYAEASHSELRHTSFTFWIIIGVCMQIGAIKNSSLAQTCKLFLNHYRWLYIEGGHSALRFIGSFQTVVIKLKWAWGCAPFKDTVTITVTDDFYISRFRQGVHVATAVTCNMCVHIFRPFYIRYVHLYVHSCVCTFMCMYIHVYVHSCVCKFMCMYIHVYVRLLLVTKYYRTTLSKNPKKLLISSTVTVFMMKTSRPFSPGSVSSCFYWNLWDLCVCVCVCCVGSFVCVLCAVNVFMIQMSRPFPPGSVSSCLEYSCVCVCVCVCAV